MSEASREKQIAVLNGIKAGYSRRMAVFRCWNCRWHDGTCTDNTDISG